MKIRLGMSVLLLFVLTSFTCWALNEQAAPKPSIHDQAFSKGHLQSWDDWLTKRSRLGTFPWELDESSRDKFQNWQDWLYKRRFGGPITDNDFNNFNKLQFQVWNDWASKRNGRSGAHFPAFTDFDKNKFQEWTDWASKRSLGLSAPFPRGSTDLDKSEFQQWNDWVSKRMFNRMPGSFQPSFSSSAGLQNWAEYVKRQNFLSPSLDLGMGGNPYFQSWHDWVKRVGADKADDASSKGVAKRHLGFSDRYGSFRRYFTDGLQDWSSFKGNKRDKDGQKLGENEIKFD